MRSRLLATALSPALAMLAAQAPPAAPAGEGAAAFTAAEANVFAVLAEWGRGEPAQRLAQTLPGYVLVPAVFASDGVRLGPPDRGGFDGGDVLVYVVPQHVGAARRVFCRRGDGALAWTDNAAGTALAGGRELQADDVLAGGGAGTALDFPRSPVRGRDGNLWLPADVVRRTTLRLRVADEDGSPVGRVSVRTMPATEADADAAWDVPLPAGSATTLLEGDAALTGVPARGLAFAVTIDGVTITLGTADVQLDGSAARLTLTRRTVQRARATRNEFAAIATLKNIGSAQSQCQASGAIDADNDGAGEYGTFAELAGVATVRGGTAKITPPVLSTAFGRVDGGVVVRSGYCFRMLLPAKDASAVPELPAGGADATRVDATQAEVLWCAYAWPLEAGVTGQRVFFVNQAGDVLAQANDDGRCSGTGKPPAPDAAFAGPDGRMHEGVAANTAGRDGQAWRVVN